MPLPSRLYAITSRDFSNCSHEEIVTCLLAGGARLIQLRDKEASAKELLEATRACLQLTRAAGATLILNDRVDVALAADADGVHLGQDDLTVAEARELLGRNKIIGLSTHSLEQFHQGLDTSADYLAIGPIYPTTTKENPDPVVGPDLLRKARALTDKPIAAIGGITLERMSEVLLAGADCVAVISALYPMTGLMELTDKPDITGQTRALLAELNRQP